MTLYDEQCERITLGTFISHTEIQGDGLATLSASDFFVPKHKELFAVCSEMESQGEAVAADTVGAWLAKTGQKHLEAALINCLAESGLPSSFKTTCRVVREFSVRRQAIATANALKAKAEDTGEDVFQAIGDADARMMELSGVMTQSKPQPIGAVITEVMQGIDDIRAGKRQTFGLSMGVPELNNHLGGFRAGKFYIVAGRPGMGKSALIAALFRSASKEGGVGLMSLEMGKDEQVTRLLSQESRVPYYRIEHAQLSGENLTDLARAVSVLRTRKFIVDDVGGLTLPLFRARVKEMVAQGVKVVAVDYLQLMQAPDADTRDQSLGKITQAMKNMAMEYQICVVALSQLNRAVESRTDKRPTLADLRESGNIEQDADAVVFVMRPEMYWPEDSALDGKAVLIIAKNRNGAAGVDVECFFDKTCMDFRPLTPRIPEDAF